MYYGKKWQTTQELETAISEYINFYNTSRIKVSLGGVSIEEHRMLQLA